jgi:hypothetical protein
MRIFGEVKKINQITSEKRRRIPQLVRQYFFVVGNVGEVKNCT